MLLHVLFAMADINGYVEAHAEQQQIHNRTRIRHIACIVFEVLVEEVIGVVLQFSTHTMIERCAQKCIWHQRWCAVAEPFVDPFFVVPVVEVFFVVVDRCINTAAEEYAAFIAGHVADLKTNRNANIVRAAFECVAVFLLYIANVLDVETCEKAKMRTEIKVESDAGIDYIGEPDDAKRID